jgi:hypothetical protein
MEKRRNAAVEEAKARVDQAMSSLQAAEQAGREPMKAHESAQKKLKAAQEQAVAEYERVHFEPKLAPELKPESAYLTFGQLEDLVANGWGFGHEVRDDGEKLGDSPINVRGLVAREPCPVKERVEVSCPKCGKQQRVSMRSGETEVQCSCGHHVRCVNGVVPEQPSSFPSSSDAAQVRDRILELARTKSAEEMIECPICHSQVKSKNLVRHFDRQHGGEATPSNIADTPPPGEGIREPSTDSTGDHDFRGGVCVRCACSAVAVEAFGWGCKDD